MLALRLAMELQAVARWPLIVLLAPPVQAVLRSKLGLMTLYYALTLALWLLTVLLAPIPQAILMLERGLTARRWDVPLRMAR